MSRLFAALGTLGLLAACTETPTQPSDAPPPELRAVVETILQGRFPLTPPPGGIYNVCTQEKVLFSGDYNLVVRSVTSNSGRSVFLIKVAANVTGVGATTGMQYVSSDVTSFTQHGAGDLSFVFNIHTISKGGAPNSSGFIRTQITFDANGNPTAFHDTFEFDVCKG